MIYFIAYDRLHIEYVASTLLKIPRSEYQQLTLQNCDGIRADRGHTFIRVIGRRYQPYKHQEAEKFEELNQHILAGLVSTLGRELKDVPYGVPYDPIWEITIP